MVENEIIEQIAGQTAISEKISANDLLPSVDYWNLYFKGFGCLYPRFPYNFNLLPLVLKEKNACMPTAINVIMEHPIFTSLGQFMEAQKVFQNSIFFSFFFFKVK